MCALLRRRTHAGAHSHSETLKYHSQMGFNDGRHPPRQFLNRISALAERCLLLAPSVRPSVGAHCASPRESGRPCKGNHIIKSPTSPTSSVSQSIPCPKYCIKRERKGRTPLSPDSLIALGNAACPRLHENRRAKLAFKWAMSTARCDMLPTSTYTSWTFSSSWVRYEYENTSNSKRLTTL